MKISVYYRQFKIVAVKLALIKEMTDSQVAKSLGKVGILYVVGLTNTMKMEKVRSLLIRKRTFLFELSKLLT